MSALGSRFLVPLPADADAAGVREAAARADRADGVLLSSRHGGDPFVVLGAAAARTTRALLVAVADADVDAPWTTARRAVSLSHLSGGRAALGIAGADPSRVAEFRSVVEALVAANEGVWPRDRESGVYVDAERRRAIDHVGEHFRVAGPLNVSVGIRPRLLSAEETAGLLRRAEDATDGLPVAAPLDAGPRADAPAGAAGAPLPGRRHGPITLLGFLKPAGEYPAAWRLPDAPVDAGVDLETIACLARTIEDAGFDALFLPDLAGLPDVAEDVLARVAVVNDALDPFALLGALAARTDRMRLVGSLSTSFSDAASIAGTVASLDRVSGGRAGWNIVTSLNDAEARNFGFDALHAHGDRYARAGAVVDAARAEWERVGIRPLLAQAGSSPAGRDLAARVADVVFTRAVPLAEAIAFRADVRARAEAHGRDPDEVRVLPELSVVVGETRADAEEAFARMRVLLDPRIAIADLGYWIGADLSGLDPDGPLPELPDGNRSRGARAEIYAQARHDSLTIAQLAEAIADGDGAVIGSASDVADRVEEFVAEGAADGFTVSFPSPPSSVDAFCSLVVPELRRRGLVA